MPTSIHEAFPSKYLKAHDLPNDRSVVAVVIEGLSSARFDDGMERPVLMFKDRQKGLVLNKTNAMAIADKFGDDMEKWIGCPIGLYADRTPFREKIVDCIRVTTDVKVAPAPEPPLTGDADSDIPF